MPEPDALARLAAQHPSSLTRSERAALARQAERDRILGAAPVAPAKDPPRWGKGDPSTMASETLAGIAGLVSASSQLEPKEAVAVLTLGAKLSGLGSEPSDPDAGRMRFRGFPVSRPSVVCQCGAVVSTGTARPK